MPTHSSIRAALATAAAASFVAGAAIVGPSAAVASAETNTANCATSQTKTYKWPGSAGLEYKLTKEVVGSAKVAPGGTVTYRTTVSGGGALVSEIMDVHPAGFELKEARESVWKLVGGQKWTTVTDKVLKDANTNSVSRSGAGWTTVGGSFVALETTYKVPDDAVPGEVYDSGASFTTVLIDGKKTANPIGTCVTIREPNAVETVTGSLDDAGLGSLTSGSTQLGGISSDPSGFVSDVINGVDVSKLMDS
ncbi:MAG TPA: hypothetical protein K8V11_13205 [Dietzia timorensis]|uniref:Secreted protein n=1 Tax=Dietzia timorensis TaxID=499555 RepID=A0A921K0C5_9ACTN|nr:hypothetical protein [Dietzia timorensis]HJE91956.1 hypothetical protein [Dietzia timorensis]